MGYCLPRDGVPGGAGDMGDLGGWIDILTSMPSLVNILRESMERGYTYRIYPGGQRPMFHRWPASKIKGARPLITLMAENVIRTNVLFQALLKRK